MDKQEVINRIHTDFGEASAAFPRYSHMKIQPREIITELQHNQLCKNKSLKTSVQKRLKELGSFNLAKSTEQGRQYSF